MPKRSSITDGAVLAVAEETAKVRNLGPHKKNPAAVALGRLGGLKGGKARAEKLTAVERSDIARRAASARWSTAQYS